MGRSRRSGGHTGSGDPGPCGRRSRTWGEKLTLELVEQPGSCAPQIHAPSFLSSRDGGKTTAYPSFASFLPEGAAGERQAANRAPCPTLVPFLLLAAWVGNGTHVACYEQGTQGREVSDREMGSCRPAPDSRAPHRLRRQPGTALPSNLTDGVWPWRFLGCPAWAHQAGGTMERPWRTCVNKAQT